jgi:putative flippase GtrA
MTYKYIHALFNRQISRYLVIGVAGYLLEIFVILAAQALGASAVLAVAIGYWVGTVCSFFLQKIVAFRDKRLHHRVLLPQILAIGLLILCNFGFTVVLTGLLDGLLPATVIRTIALALTTIWNYYLYRTRIFKVPSQ